MIKGCEPFGGQLLLLPRHPIKVPRTPTLHQLPAPHSAGLFRISVDLEVLSTTPVLLALVKDNLGMVL